MYHEYQLRVLLLVLSFLDFRIQPLSFTKWTFTFNSWAKFCKGEELNCKCNFVILDLPAWKRLVVQIGKRSNAQSLWTARQSRCPRTSRTPWSSLEAETDFPHWRKSGDTRCSCRLSWAAGLWMTSEMGSRHATPRIRIYLKMQPINLGSHCFFFFFLSILLMTPWEWMPCFDLSLLRLIFETANSLESRKCLPLPKW